MWQGVSVTFSGMGSGRYTGYIGITWGNRVYMGIQGIQGVDGYTGYRWYTWVYRENIGIQGVDGYTGYTGIHKY